MRITKEFKFEMAHKLSKSYTCKCQHIHGHSYRMMVTLINQELNDEMVVIDFTKVKEEFKYIVDLLDHNFMIHKDDNAAPELVKLAVEGNYPLLVASHNPTAEFIALVVYGEIEKRFENSNYELSKLQGFEVEVFETATSSAKVSSLNPPPITLKLSLDNISVYGG